MLNSKTFTTFIALLGVIVPIWLWYADLNSFSLEFKLASQVSIQPKEASSISGIQISVDGNQLESPYLSVFELTNNGSKPIPSSDYEAPIELRVEPEVKVIRAQVTSTKPKDIEAQITWEKNSVALAAVLLNPGDSVTIAVLTSGKAPTFSSRARIAGVSSVPINDDTKAVTSLLDKAIYLVEAILFFVAYGTIDSSAVTSTSTLKERMFPEIKLRARSASLISIMTMIGGATSAVYFIKAIGVDSLFMWILVYSGIYLVSFGFGKIWNKMF